MATPLKAGETKKLATTMEKSPEDSANFFSNLIFTYLNPLFAVANDHVIEIEELGPVCEQDEAHKLYHDFLKNWEYERTLPREKRSLWKVLWKTVTYWRLFKAVALYALYSGEQFGPVLILRSLTRHFEGIEELSKFRLWLFVVLLLVLPIAGSIWAAHSNAIFGHIGLQFRNALVTMIYNKSLKLSPAARQVSSTGQIVNMFSNDTAQLQRFIYFMNQVVLAPPTIAICIWLIYRELGPATFVGLGLMIVSMPLNGIIFAKLGSIRKVKSFVTDTRVKLMNEILSGIRVIKFYAWESAFEAKILEIRARELVLLKQIAYIVAVFFTLVLQAIPVFMPVLIFYTYSATGHHLDAAIIFTSLSFFNLLQFPFIFLPLGLAQYSQSLVACKRMLDFFDEDELAPYVNHEAGPDDVVVSMTNANLSWILEANVNKVNTDRIKIDDISEATKGESKKEGASDKKDGAYAAVAVSDAEVGIEMKDVEAGKENLVNRSVHTLMDVNFKVRKGQLVAIVGSVGSGKSSLLSALLGEMHMVSGSVQLAGSVAYCDQRAWILNDTVEGNILFGGAYNEEKFDNALYSANLEEDIKTLQGGLNTQIGERGINLSGGQKARVALARAVYRDADIYLLDDPLSAVDAHVGQFLFHECIRTTLKGKTRLLVTHQVHLLPHCDMVIVIDEGKIKAAGSYNELKNSGVDIESYIPQAKVVEEAVAVVEGAKVGGSPRARGSSADAAEVPRVRKSSADITESHGSNTSSTSNTKPRAGSNVGSGGDSVAPYEPSENSTTRQMYREKSMAAAAERKLDQRESKITTVEERQKGDVSLDAYLFYIKAGGKYMFAWLVLFVLLAQVFTLLGSFWLQRWGTVSINAQIAGDPLSTHTNLHYLNIFTAYSGASLVSYVLRSLILANHRLGTSIILHERMLKSTLFASVAFFDTTPIGRILNRFSSDLLTIDEELSQSISQIFNSLAAVLGAIGAIAGSTKGTFLILLLPLGYAYNSMQRFFRGLNTEVARLEAVSRSPIYADFSQALVGVSSVRAYGEQERFITNLEHSVNTNSVANIIQVLAGNWLAFRLDVIGSTISFFIAVIAVSTTDFIPAGYLALGLSYSFALNMYLKFLIRVVATGEAQMNSVERIMYYMNNIEQEGNANEIDPSTLPADWPATGQIALKDVQLRYRDGPLVLKGLNLDIAGKEKVGVAGRTGSGKSSLMIGLFRMQELAAGSISIDGVDIATVPLKHLRSKLGIIPQDPVMFSASVRFNLDPFNEHTDAEVWDVLASINLKDHIMSLPNKLQEEVAEGGDNFSAGQRQLICICRAILRKPKILVLDEATASIDNETDAIVQGMVRTQFKDSTVLTIAHRLNTIIDSDKILVLEDGFVGEFDSPATLLAKKDGLFKGLWDRHEKSHSNQSDDSHNKDKKH